VFISALGEKYNDAFLHFPKAVRMNPLQNKVSFAFGTPVLEGNRNRRGSSREDNGHNRQNGHGHGGYDSTFEDSAPFSNESLRPLNDPMRIRVQPRHFRNQFYDLANFCFLEHFIVDWEGLGFLENFMGLPQVFKSALTSRRGRDSGI
jgi:hypothetical protein